MWWTIYLFSVSAQLPFDLNSSASVVGSKFELIFLILNYSIIPVILLTLVFNGSTDLSEKLLTAKYAEYSIYKAQTSRWIPTFFTTYNTNTDDNKNKKN
jgi:steroid 5-alpha reductase family enzyme